MIQLPSKIRTTLFTAVVEDYPVEIVGCELDRLAVIVYMSYQSVNFAAWGRSGQDAKNSTVTMANNYYPLYFYGPEPLWVCTPTSELPGTHSAMLIHGIYRA